MSAVTVAPQALSGEVRAISSKSDAHRNLICAALSSEHDVAAVMAARRAAVKYIVLFIIVFFNDTSFIMFFRQFLA